MSYQVLRIEKFSKGDLGKIGAETERTAKRHRNEDIDKERTPLNYYFKKSDGGLIAQWKKTMRDFNATFKETKKAVAFAKEHQDWIERSLARLPQTKKFEDREQISLFGQTVTIRHNSKLRKGTFLEDNVLNVSGEAEFLHRRVKDYIKEQAKNEFYKRSKLLAEKLGCSLHDVTIKDTKSRWGSCSSMHNINYSWRIALAPENVINYLMAHEVAHLKHQDHSRAFWRCVRELYPEAETGKVWLRLHSKELYLYE